MTPPTPVRLTPHLVECDPLQSKLTPPPRIKRTCHPICSSVVKDQVQGFDVLSGEFLQILHDGEGHWATVSTIGLKVKHPAEVLVYDNKYSSASEPLKAQIASLLHTEYQVIKGSVFLHLLQH